MREIVAWGGLASTLLACNFAGSPGNKSNPDARVADAAPSDAGVDANPICDPITLRLTVDGETWTDQDPRRVRRTGDTILLNAATSCSPTGNLSFNWDFKGGSFVPRTMPAEGPIVEVYADKINNRNLTLTLSDGTTDVVADVQFAIRGFAALDKFGASAPLVKDLADGGNQLWIATGAGAFTTPLADLDNGGNDYTDVSSIPATPTDTIPADVDMVAFDSDNDVVSWVSLADDATAAYVFDRGADDIVKTTVTSDTVRDIAPLAGGGLRVVTSAGTRTTTDYTAVTDEVNQAGLRVAVVQGADLIGGGDQLYLLDADPSDNPRSIFNNGDDGIDTLFVDADGKLWIGSDIGDNDHGIGIVDDFADATVTTQLLGTKIRQIAQDADGDLWIATDAGLVRFKSDWGTFITMDKDNGLGDADVRTTLVDEGGGRKVIFAGTSGGLFVLR